MMDELNWERRTAIRQNVLSEMENLPKAIGRYTVRGELGRGGMGVVYDACDARLDRWVAVKVLDCAAVPEDERREFLERFEREMRATSRIFHENLVAILDAGVVSSDADARPYYVMERVEGPSLEEYLQKRGVLERREGLRIAAAVARGLAVVHAHGLVHRDLKPSNVLLPRCGEPRVTDFGLCHEALRTSARAGTGGILGSAHYVAPEQVLDEPVTPRTDLFALGAILTRMFSGVEPFRASSPRAHLARVLHDEPDGMDRLDADVRALVARLVAKQPKSRPADAAGVAEQLEAMADASAGEQPSLPAETGNPSHRAPRRGRLLAWLASSALLVLALMGGRLVLHNELVALDNAAVTQWRQVENQLARQHELIPRLLEVTERYLAHEAAALDRILAVARDVPGSAPQESGDALRSAGRFERALLAYLALAQRSPGLQADRQFRALAYEIAGTANRIAVERARYNEAVGRLNRRLDQFPWRLAPGSVTARHYYEPDAERLAEPLLGSGA